MGEDATGHPSGQGQRRVSVDEAARELGLSVDAVRKRVQRGTIEHEKDAAGRVHILLDSPDNASTIQDVRPDTTGQLLDAKDETISELRDRVKRLEHELDVRNEEVRRRDMLLAQLVSKVPELEAPPAEPQASQETHGEPGRVDTPAATSRSAKGGSGPLWHGADAAPEDPPRRPWWRRIFGR